MSFVSENKKQIIVFNGRMTSPMTHNSMFISMLILLHYISQTNVKYYWQNAAKPEMNLALDNYIWK